MLNDNPSSCERELIGQTCLIVIAGFHDFSSSRMERQTVPEGYTLGWKRGGVNLPAIKVTCLCETRSQSEGAHFGGFEG